MDEKENYRVSSKEVPFWFAEDLKPVHHSTAR
jgi:hypothetical protein